MATPNVLTSVNGQQPSQLASPVPSVETPPIEAPTNLDFNSLASDVPDVAQPTPTQPVNDFAQLAGTLPDLPGQPIQESPLPPPEGLASVKEQLREASTRFKNAFTVTDKESLDVLKQSGLFEDVKYVNGQLKVKRPGRKGFENFDRDKVELIGDTIDGARIAFEGVIENLFRFGGGAAGGVTGAGAGAAEGAVTGTVLGPLGTATGAVTGGGLGAIAGTAAGAAAGGAAGAIAATKAGDYVAEKLLGIKPDATRNKTMEASVAGALGAGFNMLASNRAKAKLVKEFQKGEATKTLEHAKTLADDAIQAVEEVRQAGFKLDEKGRFTLDPQQLTKGTNPNLNASAKEMSKMEGFQNFRREQGDKLKGAYDGMIQYLGTKAGKSDRVGKDFVLGANDIKQAEGAILGEVRKVGREASKGANVEAPQTAQLINKLFTELGGGVETVTTKSKSGVTDVSGEAIKETKQVLKAPSVENILAAKPGLTTDQAISYGNKLKQLQETMVKNQGTMKIAEMENLYNELTNTINSAMKSSKGQAYGVELIELKNTVRDEWTDMLGKYMPPDMMEGYAQSKAKYSEFKQAEKVLRSVLKTEDISRDALLGKLFEGKQSLPFAMSAKTMFQENDPKFWQELTTEYFGKLARENTDVTTGVMDWKAISKKWNKIGPEMQEELIRGSGMPKQGFEQLLNIGRIYQHTNFQALPKDQKVKVAQKAITIAFFPFIGTKISAAESLLAGLGKDESMMLWLKEGGVENVLKQFPDLKPTKAQKLKDAINAWTPSAVKAPVQAGAKVGGKISPTGARMGGQTLVNDLFGIGQPQQESGQ